MLVDHHRELDVELQDLPNRPNGIVGMIHIVGDLVHTLALSRGIDRDAVIGQMNRALEKGLVVVAVEPGSGARYEVLRQFVDVL